MQHIPLVEQLSLAVAGGVCVGQQTSGVSVDLINKEFDQKRVELIKTNEEEILAVRREAYQKYITEKEALFETEILKLGDEENAKSELIITQEQARLDALLAMDAEQKKALGLNETDYALLVEQQRAKVNDAIKSNMDLQKKQMQQMQLK